MNEKRHSCCILILTYKGKYHLEFLLPTVRTAMKQVPDGFDVNVLVIDNGHDEPTRDFVKEHFPDFRFEFSPV
ncbi:MAG: hypothetical protein KDD36_14815, partial [Flavobacteriales bacterium]|nr:hypothetical protein [Flavobacteriales bacterium]